MRQSRKSDPYIRELIRPSGESDKEETSKDHPLAGKLFIILL